MSQERVNALAPVYLEPRDDYWTIHRPRDVTADEQREFRLVPQGTAEQLPNAFYCEHCFPRRPRERQ
ncbi:MAG: hypothetical protein ABEJ89_00920 [Haloarculaceae archaeon]